MSYLRLLLLPLCPLWALISQTRTELYMAKVLRRFVPPVPTFVVGNLSTGGTGKSPHTAFLANLLSQKYRTAILSRGYGRKTKGFILADNSSTAIQIGDEPLMLHRELPHATLAVCENRALGIQKLLSQHEKPQVIVMDDAYQHLRVKAQCYFLLTRFDRPFFADYLLPAGSLRELRLNAQRAQCVIVTKTPEHFLSDTSEAISMQKKYKRQISRYTHAPVIFSSYRYDNTLKGTSGQKISLEEIKDYHVTLITGIAQPKPLVEYLQNKYIKVKHLNFQDHHTFTEGELMKIKNDFLNLPTEKKIILTTEKDMARLSDTELSELPLFSISIKVQMDEKSQQTVIQTLNTYIENK
ncbi:MAG: tetraacyldisaccharide 4'-kinase [Flavobacteriales bacterium]|nr:tetraacyldisaccharide 4'-kinase [Flavobacteriales bacterium]